MKNTLEKNINGPSKITNFLVAGLELLEIGGLMYFFNEIATEYIRPELIPQIANYINFYSR